MPIRRFDARLIVTDASPGVACGVLIVINLLLERVVTFTIIAAVLCISDWNCGSGICRLGL